ncbi:Metalloprotease, insulinase family protein, partial [Giardia duodenalis]
VRKQRPNDTHQPNNPTSAIITTRQPSRELTHRETTTRTRQPATTARSETPAATLHHPAKHGEEEPPILSSRPTFASGHGQKLSEFTREILGRPAGEGPSSTALA